VLLHDLKAERFDGRTRLTATLRWEVVNRAPEPLWFEVLAPFDENVRLSPETFAVAAFPLAFWFGERRLRLETELCPRLLDGLQEVLSAFRRWYPERLSLQIEADRLSDPLTPSSPSRTALFLSGGVDSLALLARNRRRHPPGTPESMSHGLFLFGLNTYDFGPRGPRQDRVAAFERYRRRLEGLGRDEGVSVVSLRTNVRALYPDFETWGRVGWVAGTVAGAHLLTERFSAVWLASTGAAPPSDSVDGQLLLSHRLSSGALAVHLGMQGVGRLERTAMVAHRPAMRAVLRTCLLLEVSEAGPLNCGACEKCVRTMLALLASGRLHQAPTFPHDDLTPAMLDVLDARSPEIAEFYKELVDPLVRLGRRDLADPLAEKAEGVARPAPEPLPLWRRLLDSLRTGD